MHIEKFSAILKKANPFSHEIVRSFQGNVKYFCNNIGRNIGEDTAV